MASLSRLKAKHEPAVTRSSTGENHANSCGNDTRSSPHNHRLVVAQCLKAGCCRVMSLDCMCNTCIGYQILATEKKNWCIAGPRSWFLPREVSLSSCRSSQKCAQGVWAYRLLNVIEENRRATPAPEVEARGSEPT